VVVLAFAGLTLLAVVRWRRRPEAAGIWLVASFGALTAVLAIAFADVSPTVRWAELAVHKVTIALLIAFPYALYRFMRAFLPAHPLTMAVANGLTALALTATLVMPETITLEADASPAARATAWLVVVQFVTVALIAAGRLWAAGRTEPPVARGRTRMLALGAVGLPVALLVSATVGAEAVTAVTQAIVLGAGVLFVLGFTPPRIVRAIWRRDVDRAVHEAEEAIATALTPEAVATGLLPAVSRVFGAEAAALIDDDGRVVGATGSDPSGAYEPSGAYDLLARADDDARVLSVVLRSGVLLVAAGDLAPYYGDDEQQLLATFGTVADLALERADLFAQERRARTQIESAHAELEAFVYGISHDLKNPLISLLGYAELLREEHGPELDDEAQHFLDRMAASAEYMHQLLNDLLELSRIGHVQTEPEEVDVTAVARTVAEEAEREHPELTVRVGDLPLVHMNPVRLRQLLTNLVDNAAKHGGTDDLTVTIHHGESDDPTTARVLVADDGVGIPVEHHDRGFTMFERLAEGGSGDGGGTGIGLSVCRRIVEVAGGSIALRRPERGTEVELVLPLPPADRREHVRGSTASRRTDRTEGTEPE
jgi:signal transduction histidine kinase